MLINKQRDFLQAQLVTIQILSDVRRAGILTPQAQTACDNALLTAGQCLDKFITDFPGWSERLDDTMNELFPVTTKDQANGTTNVARASTAKSHRGRKRI